METATKLFKITPKNYGGRGFDYYITVLVAATSIPEALEYFYREVSPKQEDIPYYLRSSNLVIETLGTIALEKKVCPIVYVDYYNGD